MNLPITTYISTLIKLIIAVFVIIIIPSIVMAETEPNDTIQQAQSIGIGYANAEVSARIATEDDNVIITTNNGREAIRYSPFNIWGRDWLKVGREDRVWKRSDS